MKTGAHTAALLFAVAAVFLGDGAALAQSANCGQLNGALQSLTGNRDFRALQPNMVQARDLLAQIQAAESEFVRTSCQQTLNAGQRLSPACRSIARVILRGRDDYNALAASIETGQAISQQREVTLQQIARFGCGTGSSATVTDQTRDGGKSPFATLLDQLFGGQRVIDNFPGSSVNGSTLRTVCVRSCDGYYWPVSFSTTAEYLQDDAATCAQQCPGSDVQLYYYHNPGEDPEQMINLNGAPYSSSPNAFRYRTEFDSSCSCKAKVNYGSVQLAAADSGNSGRAIVQMDGQSFPLPMRDPRVRTEIKIVAALQIPLPQPRPVRDGETGPVAAPVSTENAEGLRLITWGKKVVRVVGPDTPYARSAPKGS